MERAYEALEKAAVAAGNKPGVPETWELTLPDGSLVVLVRDRAEMGQVDTQGRQAQVWALEELGDIITKFPALVLAKEAFPGAVVESIRPDPKAIQLIDDNLAEAPFA